jgi:Ca2+-binding RTX toxin-like protein
MTFIGPIKSIPFPILGLYIDGTDGNDQLYGSIGNDEMHGHNGDDFLSAGAGDDVLFGDDGNDVLDGGTGNDTMHGGNGNDTFIGGPGADHFFGDAGFDTVTYAASSFGVTVDMATIGVTNDAQNDTYVGIEQIIGTSVGDILSGDANANTFRGGAGDDFLFGQAGNDEIHGQTGNDIIRGGAGTDFISGGPGQDTLTGDDAGQVFADTFVLTTGAGAGGDTVTDFQVGVDKGLLGGFGTQPFGFDGQLAVGPVGVGAEWYFGGIDAGDKVAYDPGNHTLFAIQLAWDNDEEAFYITHTDAIATFTNGADLHASDFITSTGSFHLDASDGVADYTFAQVATADFLVH